MYIYIVGTLRWLIFIAMLAVVTALNLVGVDVVAQVRMFIDISICLSIHTYIYICISLSIAIYLSIYWIISIALLAVVTALNLVGVDVIAQRLLSI